MDGVAIHFATEPSADGPSRLAFLNWTGLLRGGDIDSHQRAIRCQIDDGVATGQPENHALNALRGQLPRSCNRPARSSRIGVERADVHLVPGVKNGFEVVYCEFDADFMYTSTDHAKVPRRLTRRNPAPVTIWAMSAAEWM